MRSQDSGVLRRPRPVARAAAVVAFALSAALAGCATVPAAARPDSTAKLRTSPVGATGSPATPATPSAPATRSAPATPAKSTPAAPPTPAAPAAVPVAPASAASLPQTSTLPRTDNAAFKAAVHDIWLAVTTGNPQYARPAFFPEKAYEQVKAIADPAADWQGRLWYDFTLDVAAAHKLVKPGAVLTKVTVPVQYAQWISPGSCYNSAGYWHVPGSRVVYREDGSTHSFGIASFISWRGDWYLIHFGAVTRGGAYGIVDDPETGAGTPGPPGSC